MPKKDSLRVTTAKRPRRIWLPIALVVLTGTLGTPLWKWAQQRWRTSFIDRSVLTATSALNDEQFEKAEASAQVVLSYEPHNVKALLIAARAAAGQAAWDRAIAVCDRLSADHKRSAAVRLFADGESAVRSGNARRAEELLRLTLHLYPRDLDAIFILAFVLGAEGRSWEAAPFAKVLIQSNRYETPQLLLVGAIDKFFINKPQFVGQCLTAVPDDPLPLLASARNSIVENNLELAEKYLRQIIAREPTQLEACARLGRLLADTGRDDELVGWNKSLPEDADEHPEIWVTRGLYAMRHNQEPAAIRCFAIAARLDPNLLIANLHLGRLLTATGKAELGAKFLSRAEQLSELLVPMTTFMNAVDPLLIRRVAELCERLGRPREAVAWAELLLRREPDSGWAHALVSRLREQYRDDPPWIVKEAVLARHLTLDQYPPLKWDIGTAAPAAPVDRVLAGNPIRFTEDAGKLGIDFRYYNDAASPENTLRILEFTGGGIGIVDFDGDGWPDLYAAQGACFPGDARAPTYLDRLFRNRGGERFEDITEFCGIRESGYSQGVTVGEFDQDGFPDLYVGNIGTNRLFRNNGDGTFTDVTSVAGLVDHDWTTSCAMADLNGDAWPDLYAVNYLQGTDVYTRVCGTSTHPKACLPANFEPQQDRVWLNSGDGQFREITASTLIDERSAGRGLGVLIASIDRPGWPDIFIANDTDPNFWYVNKSQSPGAAPQFEERAVLDGLAFDADGHCQACMGIAAGDVNRDGLWDLFVTNFYRESNTLYLQQPDRSFVDSTRAAGLREPSLMMLGFGTQFLDADSDGWLDVVVTNGHVYNNTHLGEPWRMRPQFFKNTGGEFKETSPQNGPYFQGEYVGRALVNWDWNRDGRPDFAVSHLDAPLAVLTNQTPTPNHFLTLNLRGVVSNREAIGVIVTVKAGKESWTATVNAGDGYLTSNDRRLNVGIGTATMVDEIMVRWPAGGTDRFRNVVPGELLIREGGGSWHLETNR